MAARARSPPLWCVVSTDPGMLGFNEPVSSLTHFGGALVCAIGMVPLLRKAARTPGGAGFWRMAGLAVFALSAVFLLVSSGFFHKGVDDGLTRRVFQRLDHDGIYLLIAGTFTPVHIILFRRVWRWGVLAFIWTSAITGVTLTSIFMGDMPHALSVSLYLSMGWAGAGSILSLSLRHGWGKTLPLILGGLAYSVGAVVDMSVDDAVPRWLGGHEVFHVCVLLGLALHWRYIWTIADAAPTRRAG